jgi:hypothetical protein
LECFAEFLVDGFDSFEDGDGFVEGLAVFADGVFYGSDADGVEGDEGNSTGFFFDEDVEDFAGCFFGVNYGME